jgi:endothelin-converting enzyme/putative endopeptidase
MIRPIKAEDDSMRNGGRMSCAAAMLLAMGIAASDHVTAAEVPYQVLPYTPGLDVASIDRSVDACEDLYTYSCGGWQKNNPIPADQSGWSVYGKLHADNQHYLWGILEDAAKPKADRSPTEQKIGDYFAACMNVDAVEQAGSAPLSADLARIDAMSDKHALGAWVGDVHARTGSAGIFFGAGVEQDARDATQIIAAIHAGGLGLPDRDYYVKDDAKSKDVRAGYHAHVAKMFELVGVEAAAARANADVVMRIETALAKASLTRVEQRDPYKIYHRETLNALQNMVPAFDWQAYFSAAGLNPQPWFNLAQPEFVKELDALIAGESLGDLKTYMRWTLIDASGSYLSKAFVDQDFAFYSAYLRGVQTDQPRWKKCVSWVDRDLSEALGKEFVARAFPPEMKTKTLLMTTQIEAAMKVRIERLDWMRPATKRQAIAKLMKIRNKIGYPDLWRDYSALSIERGDFFGNVTRSISFESRRQAAKIGQPVDHGEWDMSAPTVNAYYDAQLNDVNFPAGVLLPPLYDAKMDDAPNYGNTGGTIGHELTHAFDDQGRKFDGDGNLRDWWTIRDAAAFETRAQCVRDQYSQYVIVDDVKINGPLTSGEDIADLGGELLAWMAWQEETRSMQLQDKDELTPGQRFFVGFAQWACANERPENLRVHAIVDPHSPPRDRVNGVVTNMPEFAQAFHCKPGQALVKPTEQVCKIW